MKRKQKEQQTAIDRLISDDIILSPDSGAEYRIQKDTSQNKLEADNDWRAGINAFRSSATLELEKIPLLEGHLYNTMESLLQRLLLLEKKVEILEE